MLDRRHLVLAGATAAAGLLASGRHRAGAPRRSCASAISTRRSHN